MYVKRKNNTYNKQYYSLFGI